jgi:hypothetical protein
VGQIGIFMLSKNCRRVRALSGLLALAVVLAPLPGLAAEVGPLSAGDAAGIKQAQSESGTQTLWLAGGGVLVALAVLLAVNNKGNETGEVTITQTATGQGGSDGSGGSGSTVESGNGDTGSAGPRGDGSGGSASFSDLSADVGIDNLVISFTSSTSTSGVTTTTTTGTH